MHSWQIIIVATEVNIDEVHGYSSGVCSREVRGLICVCGVIHDGDTRVVPTSQTLAAGCAYVDPENRGPAAVLWAGA